MRLPLIPVIILVILNISVDFYIYNICTRRYKSPVPRRLQLWSAIILWIFFIVIMALPRRNADDAGLLTVMWMLFSYISIYIAKYIYVLIDLIGKIPQLFNKKRSKIFSICAIVCSLGAFIAMWWGALVNRFNIDVREIDIPIENLPEAFNGYRIVQISDLHTGTYGESNRFLEKLVKQVNELHPDVIFFTGDIVNSRSSEITPHIPTLSKLHAPDGVIAILGNHDYGDYADWPSEDAKNESRKYLNTTISDMGWNLLLNRTEMLRRSGDSIAVIGVENIGDAPFPVYGTLSAAYKTPGDSVTKILLTHNPAHWVDSISGNSNMNIPLTLSGHTHAMQIEIGGFSPAVFRYPTWGGLYSDKDNRHKLYVNIGIGTVGFPARIGATPEITVITLQTKDSQALKH